MKVGLVNPSRASAVGMPLGLAYLASYARQRDPSLEFAILDAGVSTAQEIDDFVASPHDVVGISTTYATYNEGEDLARRIRAANPGVTLVVGGPYVSIVGDKAVLDGPFDFGVYGEGELTFSELLGRLTTSETRDGDFQDINGLILRHGATATTNPARPLIADVDSLPMPAYDLIRMDRYDQHAVLLARGCPFKCCFCSSNATWKRKVRRRSVGEVVSEIQYLQKHYPPKALAFNDDTFNIKLSVVHEFCDEIRRRGLRLIWSCQGFRADNIDVETARLMKRAGCVSVSIGIECANNRVLKTIGKGFQIEAIEEGIRTLNRGGILNITGQFMIGNPGETLETVEESIEFAKRVPLSGVSFYPAIPFPSTGLWDYVVEKGTFLVEPDCRNFDKVSPKIIFETEEFPREDRLKAIQRAEREGFLAGGKPTLVDRLSLFARRFVRHRLFALHIGKWSLGQALYPGLVRIKRWLRLHGRKRPRAASPSGQDR